MSSEGSNNTHVEIADEIADSVYNRLQDKLGPSLKPISPKDAVDTFFERRELSSTTVDSYESSLYEFFVPWCTDIQGISEMREIDGDALAEYRKWRRDKSSERVDKLSLESEETQQNILRGFIRKCQKWGYVRPGLHEKIVVPDVDDGEEAREIALSSELAREILGWLDKHRYASREHIIFALLAECGARVGGIRALDHDDFNPAASDPHIEFCHRPNEGTPLKNGNNGERRNSISEKTCEVVQDYIDKKPNQVLDEYGREPLLSTQFGRIARSTIRNEVYKWTQPCQTGGECPYKANEDISECKARRNKNHASKCPDSMSSHPVRRGYITAELRAGVPKKILCERVDVSEKVMDKHYDARTEQEKMEARKVALEMAHRTNSPYGG